MYVRIIMQYDSVRKLILESDILQPHFDSLGEIYQQFEAAHMMSTHNRIKVCLLTANK